MNTYSFKDINNVYVLGDCHGEFKTYFHDIKLGLNIKEEDAEKPHPKELERLARKQAREQAQRNVGMPHLMNGRDGRRYIRFDAPTRDNTWATADLMDVYPKKGKKSNFSPYSNSMFIIAGDCGLGFNKPKYYEDLFEKFNKILSYNNTYIIMIRGNHDDPSYFDGERINLSNIKAVPDYSVITVKNKNILCVGGAVSLDRTWRIKQEERINRFSTTKKKSIYWKDEAPIFNQEALDEITKNIKIDCVVSHTAPSFVSPESHVGIDEWSVDDKTLISDVKEERRVLDKVFETLRDADMKPKYWAYCHFHYKFLEKRSDTIFRGLGDDFNPISVDADIEHFYAEEMRKKNDKGHKKAKSKTIIPITPTIQAELGQEANIGVANELVAEDFDYDMLPDEPGIEREQVEDPNYNATDNAVNADGVAYRPVAFDDLIRTREYEIRREQINEAVERAMHEATQVNRGLFDMPNNITFNVGNEIYHRVEATNAVIADAQVGTLNH